MHRFGGCAWSPQGQAPIALSVEVSQGLASNALSAEVSQGRAVLRPRHPSRIVAAEGVLKCGYSGTNGALGPGSPTRGACGGRWPGRGAPGLGTGPRRGPYGPPGPRRAPRVPSLAPRARAWVSGAEWVNGGGKCESLKVGRPCLAVCQESQPGPEGPGPGCQGECEGQPQKRGWLVDLLFSPPVPECQAGLQESQPRAWVSG